jgi:hypothetical protein
MVERTLWARGGVPRSAVTTGIPDGARRHDPRSPTTAEAARVETPSGDDA